MLLRIGIAGVLAIGVSISAQASDLTAGQLAGTCTSKADNELMVCGLVVQSFMDGYQEGVAVGAAAVYGQDPNVLLTYKDVTGAQRQEILSRVTNKASCLVGATRGDVIQAFRNFSAARPETADWNYRVALATTIKLDFCAK